MDTLKIDLHMHTVVSDGTDTPSEILSAVREAGFELFSVTDHDALIGCQEISGMIAETDPHFLTGIEFSAKDEYGKYHILGYGYDPSRAPIRELVEKGHGFRIKKTKARLAFLDEEFGFRFPNEELEKLFAMNNPGKPHIGNMMARYGYAKSKDEAIIKYINKKRFKSEYIKPEEAITAILESGGIPVLAHPSYGSGEELIIGDEMDERIRYLMEFGLMGLEAFYSGFTEKLRGSLLKFAETYDLYVTAGSDYHGTNKLVRLGDTGLDEAAFMPVGMKRFLEDVSYAN